MGEGDTTGKTRFYMVVKLLFYEIQHNKSLINGSVKLFVGSVILLNIISHIFSLCKMHNTFPKILISSLHYRQELKISAHLRLVFQ